MVILFVAPLFEAKGEKPKGGISMYLRRVTGALKDMGHTPVILTIGQKDRHYVENGVEVYFVRCPFIHLEKKWLETVCNIWVKNVCVNRKIRELAKERRIDIIQFASIWGLSAGYYGKVPAVMRLSIYSKVYREFKDNKADMSIQALFERIAARRCNAVFAPGRVIADAFSRDIHREVSVIESPFWNESTEYNEAVYQERLVGKKYFLFFGRMVVDKGIFVIAECLHEFLRQNPDYSFVCCGIEEAACKKSPVRVLKEAAGEYKDRVIYLTSLLHNSLYPVIWHADFVVFPSLIDNFSNACLEAMYFRRVVIGTDGTSYEQLINDGRNGFLCKPNDAGSLLRKMNEVASMSQREKEEMGRYARERVDRLAPRFAVRKLLRYYRYVIERSGR